MTSKDIPFLSAAETASAISAKEVSPVEVVRSYLDRIDRLDSQLSAYITVCREEALDAARQAEEALQRGEARGPLFGVPLAAGVSSPRKPRRCGGGLVTALPPSARG